MKIFPKALFIVRIVSLLLTVGANVTWADDGDVDLTFGAQGLYIKDFGGVGAGGDVVGVDVQAGGKIVVAGHNTSSNLTCGAVFFATRLAHDASAIDATYGNAGTSQPCLAALLPAGITNENDYASSARVTPDGGLLESGLAQYSLAGAPNQTVVTGALMKRTSNGNLDSAFGTGGMILVKSNSQALSVLNDAVQRDDGAIFAIGLSSSGTPAIWALQSNGGPTAEFDDTQLSQAAPFTMALQRDGKFVVVGYYATSNPAFSGCFITRLVFQAGLLVRDTAFGTNGTTRIAAPAAASRSYVCSALQIQANGQILFGGRASAASGNSSLLFGRLNADGHVDSTFRGGVDTTYFLNVDGDNRLREIILNPDGKIYLVGYGSSDSNASDYSFGVIRLLRSGTFDISFGSDPSNLATVMVDFAPVTGGTSKAHAEAATLIGGNLVVAGTVNAATKNWIGLTRIKVTDSIFADVFE